MNRLLANETAYLTDYCDPAGLPELRAAIGTHLRRARAVAVTEDQVIVTTGGQDALNLVFNLLKSHTRQLCIENPCYLGASLIFRSAGLTIHPIPVDGEGLRTDLLPAERGSLLYVTPSHQFPTGATMTLTRRLALLQWAEETDSYIVEDDYDSDFRYDGPPLTALAGLDGGRRVFYAGTLAGSGRPLSITNPRGSDRPASESLREVRSRRIRCRPCGAPRPPPAGAAHRVWLRPPALAS